MARFSPLASFAAQLLDSSTIRVAEPSEGMGSFDARDGRDASLHGVGNETCGHTAYHRDDSYFPIRAQDDSNVAVVRFWIPLEKMPEGSHSMSFVAGILHSGRSVVPVLTLMRRTVHRFTSNP